MAQNKYQKLELNWIGKGEEPRMKSSLALATWGACNKKARFSAGFKFFHLITFTQGEEA
jgi:hypothetical protein